MPYLLLQLILLMIWPILYADNIIFTPTLLKNMYPWRMDIFFASAALNFLTLSRQLVDMSSCTFCCTQELSSPTLPSSLFQHLKAKIVILGQILDVAYCLALFLIKSFTFWIFRSSWNPDSHPSMWIRIYTCLVLSCGRPIPCWSRGQRSIAPARGEILK